MTRFLFAALFCISAFRLAACINPYHTRLDGVVTQHVNDLSLQIHEPLDKKAIRREADLFLDRYRKKHRIEDYSDYGVKLVLLGQYEDARKVFIEVEHASPNRYHTAANLGTVYELLGQPDSALIWIRKAVGIYPASHHGSEWIHIKILKFKLRKQKECDASMLGINFGNTELPVNPMNLDLRKLAKQLSYQLTERTKFVAPKDQVVGRLFFDLGNTTAQLISAQRSLTYYHLAEKYGYATPLLATRIKAMEKLSAKTQNYDEFDKVKNEVRKHLKLYSVIGLLMLVTFGIFVWRIVKRVRQRMKSKRNQ